MEEATSGSFTKRPFKRSRHAPPWPDQLARVRGSAPLPPGSSAADAASSSTASSRTPRVRSSAVAKIERQLHTRLDAWTRRGSPSTRSLNILVAGLSQNVTSEIASLLKTVAESNMEHDLPVMPISVYGASSSLEVRQILQQQTTAVPICIVLLSEALMEDYTRVRLADDENVLTSFIAFNEDSHSSYDKQTLLRSFGVLDVLSWPCAPYTLL